jgi:glycosyltransferase involved in cell wall biosynthesis
LKIAIVTDAWAPQINGVVRTLQATIEQLRARGHQVMVIEPSGFRKVSMPTYNEIAISLFPAERVRHLLDAFQPDRIHIATEGTLGWAAREYCGLAGISFTTSFHTNFPDYAWHRIRFPRAISWAILRSFHSMARRVLVNTPTMVEELHRNGITNTAMWSRGSDFIDYRDLPADFEVTSLPSPRFVYVGRVSVEKNIDAFLSLKLPGCKVVIGDGPSREKLQRQYPDVHWLGYRTGPDLAGAIKGCDVMVFPSRTDTFGLVMIEAMSLGVPVAAYPVVGPKDVVDHGVTGFLNEDLKKAALDALWMKRPIPYPERFTWKTATDQFEAALA